MDALTPVPVASAPDGRDNALRELIRATADADAHGDGGVSISFELSDSIVLALSTHPSPAAGEWQSEEHLAQICCEWDQPAGSCRCIGLAANDEARCKSPIGVARAVLKFLTACLSYPSEEQIEAAWQKWQHSEPCPFGKLDNFGFWRAGYLTSSPSPGEGTTGMATSPGEGREEVRRMALYEVLEALEWHQFSGKQSVDIKEFHDEVVNLVAAPVEGQAPQRWQHFSHGQDAVGNKYDVEICSICKEERLIYAEWQAPQGMREAVDELCDQIEATELHGGGAHDEECPICKALERVRAVLDARPTEEEIEAEIYRSGMVGVADAKTLARIIDTLFRGPQRGRAPVRDARDADVALERYTLALMEIAVEQSAKDGTAAADKFQHIARAALGLSPEKMEGT